MIILSVLICIGKKFIVIYSFIRESMSQRLKQAVMQADLKATFHLLRNAFPDLEKVPLRASITSSPYLAPLAKRLQLNIPIQAYPSQCIALYQQLNDDYLSHLLKFSQIQATAPIEPNDSFDQSLRKEENQQRQVASTKQGDGSLRRAKINFAQLATFVADYGPRSSQRVSSELVQMGRIFNSWQVDQVSSTLSSRHQFNKKESKQQSADIKFARQKKLKTEDIKIVFGKNISLQCKAMRNEIINRAQNNKLLQSNNSLTQIEKKGIQMNFILNRITQEYFQDLKQQLKPFANNSLYCFSLAQKIVEKAIEEHNFIKIYSKLVRALKNESVAFQNSKFVLFKHIFVQKLQQIFYNMVQNGQWSQNEELHKKQLLGLSLFLGELFNNRLLSKNVFPDIFYELIHRYVIQYKANSDSKSYYYQTYIECIVKLIQRMESCYDQLIRKSNTKDLEGVVKDILNVSNPKDFEFSYLCDFVQVLKQINVRLPSQRFKITFLLEDFRCSKAISKQLNNNEAQVVKSILAIDITQKHDVERISTMIEKANLQLIMKDFFFQFSQGNIKQVNKHVEIYKLMAKNPMISQATIGSFKAHVGELYLIQSDFPFLSEGIAKIMRIVCDLKAIDYYGLDLGQDSHPEEDVREFLRKIEQKYFKMSMED